MKLAIMSDSHDHEGNLRKASHIAQKNACDHILFAGDLGRPSAMVSALVSGGIPVTMIIGNNDAEIIGLMRQGQKFPLFTLVQRPLAATCFIETLDNLRICMHHYPPIAIWAAKSGEFDLCIAGHTHVFEYKKYDNTDYINPGTILGDEETAGFVIYNTTTRTHEHILLE